MQFRTQIEVPQCSYQLSHELRGLSLGSCFSATIGNKLLAAKFPISVNPFGTVYNPCSIKNCVDMIVGKRTFSESDVFYENGVWQSFLLHTDFSSIQKETIVSHCKTVIADLQNSKSIDYVIITLGTAWIYEFKKTGEVVSNCHKISANHFNRRKLSVVECVSVLQEAIHSLQAINENVHIILTVSPIRHWKDGAHENQLSKATLLLSIEELQKQNKNIHYFPAYELIFDDLRDYRFYSEDMLHPNDVAIQYVWEQFSNTFFSPITKERIQRIERVTKALAHKPFNPESEEYKTFRKKNEAELEAIQKELRDLVK